MEKRTSKSGWMKPRKQGQLEPRRYNYYIFCEGKKTEPQYFQGFKKLIERNPVYRNMVLLEIEPCEAETLGVLEQAENYVSRNKIKRGQVWCVYDKDDFPRVKFNAVVEREQKLNKENENLQYYSAWSNECVEFWFILHFSYYTSNNHRTEYIKYLNRKFNEFKIGKYEKNLPDIFDILVNNGNPKLAISYAQRIISDNKGKSPADIAPGTKVHELVLELAKYLPEEIRERFL